MCVSKRQVLAMGPRCAVAVILCALAAACATDSAKAPPAMNAVGDPLQPFSLQDQHGENHSVDTSTRLILFSRDMDGGDVVKQVLAEQAGDYLGARHAVYLADISRMPGFISKTIAIPRMRDRSYPTLLDLEGSVTARLPSQPGKATLIRLDELTIVEVRYAGTSDELRAALGI
jgi:hypothetical protein